MSVGTVSGKGPTSRKGREKWGTRQRFSAAPLKTSRAKLASNPTLRTGYRR
jgi:hypothetical protein